MNAGANEFRTLLQSICYVSLVPARYYNDLYLHIPVEISSVTRYRGKPLIVYNFEPPDAVGRQSHIVVDTCLDGSLMLMFSATR